MPSSSSSVSRLYTFARGSMNTQSPQLAGRAGRGRFARRSATTAKTSAAAVTSARIVARMTMPISVRPLRPYPPYQEVTVRKTFVSLVSVALVLSACGGAGAGGAAPSPASTPPSAAPAVARAEEPKQYNPGKTADPNASPDYYGY